MYLHAVPTKVDSLSQAPPPPCHNSSTLQPVQFLQIFVARADHSPCSAYKLWFVYTEDEVINGFRILISVGSSDANLNVAYNCLDIVSQSPVCLLVYCKIRFQTNGFNSLMPKSIHKKKRYCCLLL